MPSRSRRSPAADDPAEIDRLWRRLAARPDIRCERIAEVSPSRADPPPSLSAAEAAAAMAMEVAGSSGPVSARLDRDPPRRSWERHFEEGFFTELETLARTLWLEGDPALSARLLHAGEWIAERRSRPHWARRLRGRLRRQTRQEADRARPRAW